MATCTSKGERGEEQRARGSRCTASRPERLHRRAPLGTDRRRWRSSAGDPAQGIKPCRASGASLGPIGQKATLFKRGPRWNLVGVVS